MMSERKFEYANSWNSPRFWFAPNIGDVVQELSLSHGLAIPEFTQHLTLARSVGSFLVFGDFQDVKLFGQRLEFDYKKYLTLPSTDWDFYAH
jgi:hypothetical protein